MLERNTHRPFKLSPSHVCQNGKGGAGSTLTSCLRIYWEKKLWSLLPSAISLPFCGGSSVDGKWSTSESVRLGHSGRQLSMEKFAGSVQQIIDLWKDKNKYPRGFTKTQKCVAYSEDKLADAWKAETRWWENGYFRLRLRNMGTISHTGLNVTKLSHC